MPRFSWIPVALVAAVQATPRPAPTVSLVGAAFDQSRGRMVIVGAADSTPGSETWEWDGTGWLLADRSGPGARSEPLMVYDRARKVVVLHGGTHRDNLNDTWEWNGITWHRVGTEGPPPRAGSAMAYDARRNRVVLFGGAGDGGALLNDLWEWDGHAWAQLVGDGRPGSPPARALHGLAYDESRGRLVLQGGYAMVNGRPHPFGDTWEWDGTAWHAIEAAGPGPRDHVAMVYDPARRAIVLHGGGQPDIGLGGDTWLYNGTGWTRLLDDGPRRGRHRLVYDDRAGVVVLYGGWGPQQQMSETWVLGARSWTRVSPR